MVRVLLLQTVHHTASPLKYPGLTLAFHLQLNKSFLLANRRRRKEENNNQALDVHFVTIAKETIWNGGCSWIKYVVFVFFWLPHEFSSDTVWGILKSIISTWHIFHKSGHIVTVRVGDSCLGSFIEACPVNLLLDPTEAVGFSLKAGMSLWATLATLMGNTQVLFVFSAQGGNTGPVNLRPSGAQWRRAPHWEWESKLWCTLQHSPQVMVMVLAQWELWANSS